MPGRIIGAAALLSLLLTFSCSFDYDNIALTDEEKAQIPDILLNNLTERVYQEGNRLLELSSDELKTFESRSLQEIRGLKFTQYDGDGAVSVEGQADFASRDLNNDQMFLQGSVEIRMESSKSTVKGEKFIYSPEQDLIWAPDDSPVTLVKTDGSVLSGRGFVVDLVLQELRFDSGARGTMKETGTQ